MTVILIGTSYVQKPCKLRDERFKNPPNDAKRGGLERVDLKGWSDLLYEGFTSCKWFPRWSRNRNVWDRVSICAMFAVLDMRTKMLQVNARITVASIISAHWKLPRKPSTDPDDGICCLNGDPQQNSSRKSRLGLLRFGLGAEWRAESAPCLRVLPRVDPVSIVLPQQAQGPPSRDFPLIL